MTQLLDSASDAVVALLTAATAVADAVDGEHAAVRVRDDHKIALVNALVGNTNPLTGKPHSATSAGDAAEQDARYRTLDDARRAAERVRILAWAEYDAAKLRAKLAVVAAEGAA